MATTTAPPQSARSRYAFSALLAARAAREAAKVRGRGVLAVARVLRTAQVTQAVMAERAVAEMLAEQDIESQADALLNSLAFTTETEMLSRMLDATETDAAFDRLVESLVQDAGRAAESVSTAVRADIWHVRFLSPPSCARCAVLAGRVYRWSSGFERHTNCDCVMIPTTVANRDLVQDPVDLFERGLIVSTRRDKKTGRIIERPGLSEADAKAIADGADFGQVVNVRRGAGLQQAGRVLARKGKPTPEGIYRLAGDDRARAVELLAQHGYIRS